VRSLGATRRGRARRVVHVSNGGIEVLTTLVEECLGVPLVLYSCRSLSVNTSLVYCQDEDDANAAVGVVDVVTKLTQYYIICLGEGW
jgi:hypothetical protein